MLDGKSTTEIEPFVRLDFGGRQLLYSCPREVIETRDPAEVLTSLDKLRGQQAAGFISYEAGHALEPKLTRLGTSTDPDEPPLLWFAIFDSIEAAPPLPSGDRAWAGVPVPGLSFEQYAAAVDEIRTNIADGDVYQVNFTFPCSVAVAGSPVSLYAQLCERARANWSALIFTGAHWLISCSPELFFATKGGRVSCRPMKGTAAPSSDPEALRNDPKNRAENLMIVDLMRNDLSRIATPGSVKVPRLFEVEHYPTLLQMTSTVVGDLQRGRDAVDVLKTIFPCGSITGAPKIAAMERIDALERSAQGRRGPYTGSIGHVLENGDAEFNVAIRTLVLKSGEASARYNVGSAIVYDSSAEAEWRECLQKAAFVASGADFQLLETFSLAAAPNPLLQLHVDRLGRSAAELGFAFDRAALEAELQHIRKDLRSAIRLRIILDRSGAIQLERSPLPAGVSGPVAVTIIPRPTEADDFRLYYKTSDRRLYDDARLAAGTFEVLFADGDGFLTEGSFTNLFVPDGEQFFTPPLRRGLLPGILRQYLIDEGVAVEKDLRPADLDGAFFVGNSLRGMLPAVLERLGKPKNLEEHLIEAWKI